MKDTLKTLELLEEHIDRVAEQGIYEIERDLLLERLRGLYATIIATEAIAEEERVLDALVGIGAATPLLAEEEPEIEIERIYAEEQEEEPEVEEETEEEEVIYSTEQPEEEPEVVVEPEEQEPKIEEKQAEVEKTLFEEVTDKWLKNILQVDKQESEEKVEEEILEPEVVMEEPKGQPEVSEELDHEVVMSLYDDDDEEEEEEEEPQAEESIAPQEETEVCEQEPEEDIEEIIEVVEEPAEAEEEVLTEELKEPQEAPQSVVLGDVLATEQPTLADNLAEQVMDVATASSANLSLRQAIAINDKFILMRDLFAGSNDYYEMAIEKLDSFDNLDEAMLYIYDNFHWNPNSEGARLLMELLARKLF